MDWLGHDSPYIQLLAFTAACAVLSSGDAHQLADCLPHQFNELKQVTISQSFAGTRRMACKLKQGSESLPCTMSLWNRCASSVILRAVPSAAHDPFYTKLVELGVKTLSNKVGNQIASVWTQKSRKVCSGVCDAMKIGWEKWIATLGLVGATSVCYFYSQTSSYNIFMMYDNRLYKKQVPMWLSKMMQTLSVDNAVLLGMGLLGGVAAAATAVSSMSGHSLLFDAAFTRQSDINLSKDKNDDNTKSWLAPEPRETREFCLSVPATGSERACCNFLQCNPDTKLLVATTDVVELRNADANNVKNKLLCICAWLVAIFSHRMKCQKENYAWLLSIYYSRLYIRLKSSS